MTRDEIEIEIRCTTDQLNALKKQLWQHDIEYFKTLLPSLQSLAEKHVGEWLIETDISPHMNDRYDIYFIVRVSRRLITRKQAEHNLTTEPMLEKLYCEKRLFVNFVYL